MTAHNYNHLLNIHQRSGTAQNGMEVQPTNVGKSSYIYTEHTIATASSATINTSHADSIQYSRIFI